jgi:hypothetical protein
MLLPLNTLARPNFRIAEMTKKEKGTKETEKNERTKSTT